jgi:hypothetical protein
VVTQRLRATIKRIDAVHPALGPHLTAAVRTGVYCSFRPEQLVTWTVDRPSPKNRTGEGIERYSAQFPHQFVGRAVRASGGWRRAARRSAPWPRGRAWWPS